MASKSKKSTGANGRKSTAPVEPTDTTTATEEVTTPEPAPVEAPRRTAEEWMSVCQLVLGVKPRILRATVSGHTPGRRYTEDEIRRLIQRKLNEPA